MLTPLLLSTPLVAPLLQAADPAALASVAAAPAQEIQHLVEVDVDLDNLEAFRALDLDVIEIELGAAEVLVSDAELARLRRGGFEVEVVVQDLAGYYAQRLAQPQASLGPVSLGAWLSPVFGQGGMGGYYTLGEIESVLDQMRAAYPSLITARQSIGTTLEGRSMWMVKISDNPEVDEAEPEARFDSLHHAREPEGMQANLWFMLFLLEGYGTDPLATYLVDERELYFIPCVNPDGYEFNRSSSPGGGGLWRKNRRNHGGGSFGVDLNRNYPFNWGLDNDGSSPDPNSETYRGSAPQSEPEVQAMVNFITGRDFETALSIHTFGGYWLSPWGYEDLDTPDAFAFDELGALATENTGYLFGPAGGVLYLANGVTFDYDYGAHGTLGWTPEIGEASDGFWPVQGRIVPLAEQNLRGMQVTALAAGAWVRVEQVLVADNAGDGDGFFEAGETVDLTVNLRNSGRRLSGPIAVELSTTSTDVTLGTSMSPADVLQSFESGAPDNTLELNILPGTPPATEVPYTVTVTYEGLVQTFDGSFVVGEQVSLAAFDFDAGGNQGWTVGNPNDATTGTWERGNPIGTEAQPEDDHTEGPGLTDCWFTGQGSVGGSLGENDVDNGSTTLYSPVFDLAGRTAPTIRYWRWFSNQTGGSAGEDTMDVELSNNGGASWTTVEVVGPTGPGSTGGWFEFSFQVDSVLAPTDQMQMRFIASDLGGGSIVEAALDDFEVSYFEDDTCPVPSNYCVGATNSAGPGATLSSSGSTEIHLNNFILEMSGGVPGTTGLYYYGPNQIQAPFGDGFRCVGGATRRLYPPLSADGSGSNMRAVDFTVPPAGGGGPQSITPLSTWNFQLWYRDAAGPGGTGFNLSDGLTVTFCP